MSPTRIFHLFRRHRASDGLTAPRPEPRSLPVHRPTPVYQTWITVTGADGGSYLEARWRHDTGPRWTIPLQRGPAEAVRHEDGTRGGTR